MEQQSNVKKIRVPSEELSLTITKSVVTKTGLETVTVGHRMAVSIPEGAKFDAQSRQAARDVLYRRVTDSMDDYVLRILADEVDTQIGEAIDAEISNNNETLGGGVARGMANTDATEGSTEKPKARPVARR